MSTFTIESTGAVGLGYLEELEQLLERPTSPERLAQLLYRAVADLAEWRRRVIDALDALDGRLEIIEQRLLIVNALPAEAPFGALIRLRGDATGSVYTGNGPGRPLGRLTPTSL